MATVTKAPFVGRDDLTSSQVQKLLQLAEGLEKVTERNETIVQRHFFALVLSGAICAFVTMLIRLLGWPSPSTEILTSAMLGLIEFIIVVQLWAGIIRVRKIIARDRTAVYEIVGTLRELERAIAEGNNLSPLERLELRVRLARFDVDSEYRSHYWPLFK